MSYYPKLTLAAIAIPKAESFELYGREELASSNQVHIRLVNEGAKVLGNLRCTPSEALEYAQQIIDAANSFAEAPKDI